MSGGQGPLDGIRILDLGRFMAAPWAAQILGDLGAEIIKIERPGTGDQFRQYGPPFLQDEDGHDTLDSSYYISTNRNKKSVTVDLSKPEGQSLIRRLAAHCDVLIENFKTGDLARYGLDYESLKVVHPGLVYASITAFGQTGPYADRPGLDSVFQAMSGMMSVTGDPEGPPQKVGVVIIDVISGLYAAIGVLAALRHREVQGGTGQQIDLALLDAAIAVMSHRSQDYLLTGELPVRAGTGTPGSAPAQIFRTADGSINIQAGDDGAFAKLCGYFSRTELLADDRFRTRSDRWRNIAELIPLLEPEFASRTTRELYDGFVRIGIVNAPVYTLDQTFSDPQVVHRRMRREIDHAAGRPIALTASPLNFSQTPIETYQSPPTLGLHTDQVLEELLDLAPAEIDALRAGAII